MEKLLDVTAEELPETMAAVRLSGMEISDLTMELSDIGSAFQTSLVLFSHRLSYVDVYNRRYEQIKVIIILCLVK